ncbi:M20/M25/M40 family metallo-hydrolase [Myxococcus stipitatus]|nr:M20/M25/M40 family metallo-hydrolase [Myxococcus stipitatus]
MHMKRLASLVLMLGCVSASAKAPASEKEVWITLGTDALSELSAAYIVAGESLPSVAAQKGGVAALKLRESDLERVSHVIHDKLKRCGGFMAHESEAAALTEVASVGQPQLVVPLAADYTLDNGPVANTLVAGVAESNILATITHLSSYTTRHYKSATGVEAANWLKARWEEYAAGRSDVTVQLYTHAGWIQPSVILTIQGTTAPSEVVVLGGHLDSISSGSTAPGADDDASGVASLTEVIRAAFAADYRPAKTVKFMAYAGEEAGLLGSKEIANAHKAAGTNVIGVLQLDMTNYKGSTVDVGLMTDYTNAAQNTFVTNLIAAYIPGMTWQNSVCGYGCSDHASWHAAGYATSMPFEALMNQHNQTIHSSGDVLSVSGNNANHALKFAKLAGAYVAELAGGTATVSDATPPTVSLTAPLDGSSVSGSVTLSANAADNIGVSRVEFLVDGVVIATATASPYTGSWNSAAAANGAHVVAARAFDLIGNSTTSTTATVTSTNASTNAVYDTVLKVPRCSNVGNACDSTTLLNGRAALGPELNAPNTINNSCADGPGGVYHSDESVDRLKVSTVSGASFQTGQVVRIDATVWVYSLRQDKLDLYYAADATNPVWVKLPTLTATATGAQTLSATYTLPAGGAHQAVRARFRYSGSAAACGTGSYDDHDDIVFAVQP